MTEPDRPATSRPSRSRRKSCVVLTLCFFGLFLVIAGTASFVVWNRFVRPVKALHAVQGKFEQRVADSGRSIIDIAFPLDDGQVARSLTFTKESLATHELYLKPPTDHGSYLHIDATGDVRSGFGSFDTLTRQGELLLTPDGLTLFIDDRWIGVDLADWRIYWISASPTEPPLGKTAYAPLAFADGFMRTELIEEPWQLTSGDWQLNQYGAGMPLTEAQAEAVSLPRTVNPFSVRGSGNGLLTCMIEPLPHLHAEARFYFGIPRTTDVVNTRDLPPGEMQVVIGPVDGPQASFGWHAATRRFVLRHRAGPDAEWQTVPSEFDRRPPITNWVTIALQVRNGHQVAGLLDGVEITQTTLPFRLAGPMHILCGEPLMEFDDAACYSLPKPPEKGTPLFVQSRQFAAKELHQDRDSVIFEEWTRGIDTFLQRRVPGAEDERLMTIVNRLPLFGNVLYESVPHAEAIGALPTGTYEYRLLKRSAQHLDDPLAGDEVLRLRFLRHADGWESLSLPDFQWPAGHREFTLRIKRDQAAGDRLMIEVNGTFIPLGMSLAGPLHLAIARIADAQGRSWPQAGHHMIYTSNLVQDLFEQAPTAWNWIEGSYRMDQRWACANMWNLLVGGATGLSYLAGKQTYHGDQEHEYFMSLRPAFPWDAGDTSWQYDPSTDSNWEIFQANNGWYVRRDLNFAWSTNGVDPMSGYALIFAGYDNTETMLLRRGKVVATTRDTFIPRAQPHGTVHWLWWHFHVRTAGNRIQVMLNNKQIFDYEDPQPLAGGHAGIWGVRNAYTVTRYRGAAEELGSAPHRYYVQDDDPGPWQPLVRDGVRVESIQQHSYTTRVTATRGGGFQAVRWRPTEPVDLRANPVLALPLQLGPSTRVNLHLDIGGKGYLVQINAPLGRMRVLLTPEFEVGEQFQVPYMDGDKLRRERLLAEHPPGAVELNLVELLTALSGVPETMELRSITIGNSSNEEYLMAGNGGNRSGSWYLTGTPSFRPAAGAEDAE